jgi:hypothetical protein
MDFGRADSLSLSMAQARNYLICGAFRSRKLDDRFHETHPIGCHHSSLVTLACRSYILVIRSWSAYDSNHGSARLVTPIVKGLGIL